MTRVERTVALGWILLSGAHALLGFVYPQLPAWKMFREVHRYEYTLQDREGRPLELRDYVQPRAQLIFRDYVLTISAWIAEAHPERAPIQGHIRTWQDGQLVEFDFRAMPRSAMPDSAAPAS